MSEGFILLHRKIIDSQLWPKNRAFTKTEAWIDLLLMARYNHEPIEIMLGNELVLCGRGQIIKSVKTYQNRWNWGAQRVKSFFEILLKLKQIEKKTTTKTTIITICNYDSYQGEQQTKNKPKINQKQTKNKQKTIKKQREQREQVNISRLFYENEKIKNKDKVNFTQYEYFYDLICGKTKHYSEEMTSVLNIEKQVSFEQFSKLLKKSKYNGQTGKKLSQILMSMANDNKYTKGKTSLYLTVNGWLNRDFK